MAWLRDGPPGSESTPSLMTTSTRRISCFSFFEGGGFGVGSDVEMFGGVRFDFRPMTHFGLTGGYNLLYFKVTNEVAKRTFKIEQSLHGPVLGIGLYF